MQTPLSSKRVAPALVASYDVHGRTVCLFYAQPTGQQVSDGTSLHLYEGS